MPPYKSDLLEALHSAISASLDRRVGALLSEAQIDALALDTVVDVQRAFAGQQLYMPMDSEFMRRRIFQDFTGDNVPELVRRYHMSTGQIYKILEIERARERGQKQPETEQCRFPGI